MSDSLAARQTARMIDRDRELLARDAQDASDALARFAKDVDAGIATGVLSQITQEMQQIVTRASSLKTAKEIVGLYEAERDIDDRTAER